MSTIEAKKLFNELLLNAGCKPFSEGELKDWDFYEGMTTQTVVQWANDLISEEHSNKCENKNAWRYEH